MFGLMHGTLRSIAPSSRNASLAHPCDIAGVGSNVGWVRCSRVQIRRSKLNLCAYGELNSDQLGLTTSPIVSELRRCAS